jgi:hypothetical protein
VVKTMANSDDQRTAAGIMASLSGLLITASLTMLAIEGALLTFVLGNRHAGFFYYADSILAFLCFVISSVCGGWGITRIAEKLSAGNWKPSVASELFSAQVLVTYVGLLSFIISFFLSGQPVESDVQKVVTSLQTVSEDIRELKPKREEGIQNLSQSVMEMDRKLNRRIDKLESDVKRVKKGSRHGRIRRRRAYR